MPRVVTFEGKLDGLELHKLESGHKKTVEKLLEDEFGAELRVRFVASEGPSTESPPDLAEYAAALFGGSIVAAEGQPG